MTRQTIYAPSRARLPLPAAHDGEPVPRDLQPRRHHRSSGVSAMSGVALWLMIPAMASGCLAFLSIILDHYDRRGNEGRYRLFLRWATRIGFALTGCVYAVDFLT